MFFTSAVHALLGPWGVAAAVRLGALPPAALSPDLSSAVRLRQFRALKALRQRHLDDPWVAGQIRRLIRSEYPLIRGLAAGRLLEARKRDAASDEAVQKQLIREATSEEVPTVTLALQHAADRRLPGCTRFVASIVKLGPTATLLPQRMLQQTASSIFAWAKELPLFSAECARAELPDLLRAIAEPTNLLPGDKRWLETVVVPFAGLLIARVAADVAQVDWLTAQRDEIALAMFQHSPHPRMTLLCPIIDAFARVPGIG